MPVLVDLAADVHAHTGCGETALYRAAEEEQVEAMQVVVTLGVDVDVQNQDGETAFHRAARARFLGA